MIEHWYEILPAAWFTPEGRWYVFISVMAVFTLGYLLGFFMGRRIKNEYEKKN